MKPLYVKKNGTVNKVSGVAMPNTFPANRVGYDNTESELQATNTQDAIDEVVDIVADKVDKVVGKSLSTNDYDNTDKAKVGKIDETTTSASGNPISITGLKSNQLAKDPVIIFEPIQAGSGDPSPSNVRAISGYDKIEVLSCGKNLWSYGDVSGSISILDMQSINPIASGSYTLSIGESSTRTTYVSFSFYDKNDNVLGDVTLQKNQSEGALTLTGYATKVTIYTPGTVSLVNIQIEVGSLATTYEPYKPSTDLTIQLGQTVYGGTLDVETGVLTVDRGYKSWKWSDGTGSTNFTNTQRRVFEIGTEYTYAGSKWLTNVTNTYLYDAGADVVHYYYELSTFVLFMPLNTDGNSEIQLVYPLATPYTIQLTPHEISLLKDYAYVSTNGTNMSFSYKNGEMASLGDVENLGKTVNLLGNELNTYTRPIYRNTHEIQQNDTITITNLLSGTTYLVSWAPQYPLNSNGLWIVFLGTMQQVVTRLCQDDYDSLELTAIDSNTITFQYKSPNGDRGTLSVLPI